MFESLSRRRRQAEEEMMTKGNNLYKITKDPQSESALEEEPFSGPATGAFPITPGNDTNKI